MDQEKVGKFIKQCRMEANLSQTDLANKLGITNKAVSKWENGRCMPDISLLEPLSIALGVSINEIIKGEKIAKIKMDVADQNISRALKYYEQAKRRNLIIKAFILVFLVIIVKLVIIIGSLMISVISAKVVEVNDVSLYKEVIGSNAKHEYQNKWGMKEEIFPKNINDLHVHDFKFVYYNPWDAQYLAYLVVDFKEEEKDRLVKLGIDDYLGYYGVTGFGDNFELLAMEASESQGFVYAITDGDKIIYVELIFCNYFYDIEYKNYINEAYLPVNFDATRNNKYRERMLKE